MVWITHCSKIVVVRCAFVFFETEESKVRGRLHQIGMVQMDGIYPVQLNFLSGVSFRAHNSPWKAASLSPFLLCMEANEKPICDPPFTNTSDSLIGAPDSQIGRYD